MDMQVEKDSPLKFIKRNLSIKRMFSVVQRGYASIKNDGISATYDKIMLRVHLMLGQDVSWFYFKTPKKSELKKQSRTIFKYMPKISIVVPLYNTPHSFLTQLIDSVEAQTYSNWQLVLVNGGGRYPLIEKKAQKDTRFTYVVLDENLGISQNTNAGFKHCTGDYIALLDHDDMLTPYALYENVKAINEYNADFLYSDEAIISEDVKELLKLHCKPNYAPDFLSNINYITHLIVFKKDLFNKVGAYLCEEFDGAQDFDLILRLTEKAKHIHHIPKVLYLWRTSKNSTACDISAKSYAIESGQKAIQSHLERIGRKGKVSPQQWSGSYRIKYDIIDNPLISIIIPNKDSIDDLSLCLKSIQEKGGYDNVEIIVVENNSTDAKTFEFYNQIKQQYKNLTVVTYTGGFNFSAICNYGFTFAKGEHILLLNNDVEFTAPNSIVEMLMFSQRSDVGAVGAKLFYPDGSLQHAGVIIGINGSAGHSHKGLQDAKDNSGNMCRLVTCQNFMAVTGACLMVKSALYKENPLDEKDFAVAYNDVDFCLRLYEKGFLNVYTPHAQATHYESKSRGSDTDKPNPRYEREKECFANKWQKYFNYGDVYYNPHLTLKYENFGYK